MDTWLELFSAVSELIPFLSEKKRAEKEHTEKTLQALNEAYYATEAYFAGLEEGEEPSRQKQYEVAHKWDDLSHMIYRYNPTLASRLSLKSRFWRENCAWSEEQKQQANIGLDQVRRDGRLILIPRHRKG
ncbi:hypothetical protein L1F06_007205 [Ectopseudomonas hydrolytica]|uniref:Uncharacterized protein n=1 Tax=Ectopseudomonas hydrolytica TaxID=2493633 RepID=A0ABY5ABG4_9GAMM|nr:hypothetical protein [Pseudomonas hydrolytica]USR41214.1 hypothetical protein L1F06_007205 [Pseudomonas hydrolytica]